MTLPPDAGFGADAEDPDGAFSLAHAVAKHKMTIARRENHIVVDTEYKKRIQLAPGFQYEWPFALHVDTINFDSAPAR